MGVMFTNLSNELGHHLVAISEVGTFWIVLVKKVTSRLGYHPPTDPKKIRLVSSTVFLYFPLGGPKSYGNRLIMVNSSHFQEDCRDNNRYPELDGLYTSFQPEFPTLR